VTLVQNLGLMGQVLLVLHPSLKHGQAIIHPSDNLYTVFRIGDITYLGQWLHGQRLNGANHGEMSIISRRNHPYEMVTNDGTSYAIILYTSGEEVIRTPAYSGNS